MKRKIALGIGVLAFLLIVGALLLSGHSGLKVYQGKSIKDWALQTGSPTPKEREQSTAAFKAIGVQAVPELRALLRAGETPWRRFAWTVGVKLPLEIRRPLLIRMGPPRAASIQSAAARSLAIIGPDARAAIPDLEWALRGRDTQVACEAARALGYFGKEGVAPLLEALKPDRDRWVRSGAASALGQIGPPAEAAIPALAELLAEPDESIRGFAVTSLSSIGPAARPALIEAMEHGNGLKRRGAAKALQGFSSSRKLVIPPLISMLQDPDPATRQQAAETIPWVVFGRDEALIASLRKAAADTNADVSAAAAKALEKWK